ncbi:MAG: Eco57I restriction-modification methylase domain-containing protein [Runella sp.]
MEKKALQNILSKPFKLADWQKLLHEVFGITKLLAQPSQISLTPNDLAESAFELGKFQTADDRLIGLYWVKVSPNVRLEKNKVGLRALLRSVYRYDVDAALIVFEQAPKWRFSFVSQVRILDSDGHLTTKETEPKRFTYLLGQGESCRTAADRFDNLRNKPLHLNDLFEAFSVEKLNKDFFKSYKEFFEKFSRHLADIPAYRQILLGTETPLDNGWQDEAAKPIRDFAKKLLGRLVFLQFLEKKGWLGVPHSNQNEQWTGGDPVFLQNLLQHFHPQEHFHSQALKTLFFETLNQQRPHSLAPDLLNPWQTPIKIPYLNGGLFDKDLSYHHDIDFPPELFKELFDFFDAYNFTIDENDPYDHEVGIDPEMLGHIFENLLEENREKGAFYTPKEIVHYMCQESLIEYLHTQLPHYNRADFVRLVRHNQVAEGLSPYQNAREINNKLKAVKICDPAIGSGAFPMGLLKEIFECRRLLYGYLKTHQIFDPAQVKKEIIQQNIYGVDIENGAVEIARLRFWLALVVDETQPQPLPNLDYKIMQGNSLLESFEGIDLSKVHTISQTTTIYEPQKDLFGNLTDPQLKITDATVLKHNNLPQLIQDFFDETDPEKKQQQRDLINQTVHEHLDYNLELCQLSLERQIAQAPDRHQPALKATTRKKIEELHKQLFEIEEKRKKLHQLQNAPNKPYFLWKLFFDDVFQQGGFDIVIGNPPYIQLQKDRGRLASELQNQNFQTFERTGDIYSLFYEKGIHLLKHKGHLCFITSNKWMRAGYGKSTRAYFIQHNPLKLIDLGSGVFESATVDTNILLLQKTPNQHHLQAADLSKSKNLQDLANLPYITLQHLTDHSWTINSDIEQRIKTKIEAEGKPLKDWDIQIYRGILTGYNEAFIIDGSKRAELIAQDPRSAEIIKPLLRGRDIKRYQAEWQDLWLIFVPWHFSLHKNPSIKGASEEAEKEFAKQFPAIYNHLLSHKEKLMARNKSETGIRYEWYALQRWAADYYQEFEKEKIIFQEMVQFSSFIYDNNKSYFCLDTGRIITGKNLKFLIAILNSNLFFFAVKNFYGGGGLGETGVRMKHSFFENFVLKQISEADQAPFVSLVDQILAKKAQGEATQALETQIDGMVYQLYGLTYDEVKVIDPEFPLNREAYESESFI